MNYSSLLTEIKRLALFLFIFNFAFMPTFRVLAYDPDDVVLYGKDSVILKTDSMVNHGDVVSGKNLKLEENSEIDGDVYAKKNLFMADESFIEGDAFLGNRAFLEGAAEVVGSLLERQTDIPSITIPNYIFTAGTEEVVVHIGERRVLSSGAYGDVTVSKGATLVFAGGDYQLNSFVAEPGSRVVIKDRTFLEIVEPFVWGSRVLKYGEGLDSTYDFILYTASDLESVIRKGAYFKGTIYSPYGSMVFRKQAKGIGVFQAREIVVSPTAVVSLIEEISDGSDTSDGSDASDGGESGTSTTGGTTESTATGGGTGESGTGDSGGTSTIGDASTGSATTGGETTGGGEVGGSTDGSLETIPPVDSTVSTTLGAASEFLYTGTNPIQTGVAEGTMDATKVSVIRGQVTESNGVALSGVTIKILNHDEFGSTQTRSDGMFDMAVNGGNYLTVVYEKEGYIPVHRKVNTPWMDYVWAEDVVMLGYDSQVTEVDLTGATTTVQMARGSESSDEDGTRTATLLFPTGTQATMTLEDGTEETLTTLNVRATEYTVGEDGFKAMPATLPANSAYTYAVELSVDEAINAAATTVHFNQPVFFYVENFLNFPVGEIVPTGYYDKEKSAWVASENGTIIQILGDLDGDGATEIDSDGDGVAENETTLSDLSFTYEERQNLLTNYVEGQTLWRVPLTHFSSWDCNWGFGPPDDAEAPDENPDDDQDDDENNSCEQDGSIIECQNQTLGEKLPIVGTPFTLNYRSSRVAGRLAQSSLKIQVTGDNIPDSLKSVVLEVKVAGRFFLATFPAATNQETLFNWDGLDAYGRKVHGAQTVTVRIGYVYDGVYTKTLRFGYNGNGTAITGDKARREVTLWQTYQAQVNAFDQKDLGLGGWSLSSHHYYDLGEKAIYFGNGKKQTAEELSPRVIEIIAGMARTPGYTGDGGQATSASLSYPRSIVSDGEGNLFVSDRNNHVVRKIDSQGIITTVAGNGTSGSSGDGGLATNAQLISPIALAVDQNGNLFIADENTYTIRKVDSDGIITKVAGIYGTSGYTGDGGLATNAHLSSPTGLAVDDEGNLYFSDYVRHVIRKVDTSGIITTVAGLRVTGYRGDGGPATSAVLGNPSGVAIDSNGNLFISDSTNQVIRKVDPSGIITTVAGNGSRGYTGDGGPAIDARLSAPYGITVDDQGNLFIADEGNHVIRQVNTAGIITTVAGTGTGGYSGDKGLARAAQFNSPHSIAINKQDHLFIADQNNHVIRKVSPGFSGFSGFDIAVSSEDGTELYQFSSFGQHQRTVDTLTGVTLYSFGYDANHLLTTITDEDGNITTINRNSNGDPISITGPYGQTTNLELDENGYLSQFTNPDGKFYTMTYEGDGGLLNSFTNPKGYSSTFEYDTLGYLEKDTNAAGNFQSLDREKIEDGYQVNYTSSEGISRSYAVQTSSAGVKTLTNTFPDGNQNSVTVKKNGENKFVFTNGKTISLKKGPDPRFGMKSPINQQLSITTPSGLSFQSSQSRTVSLSDLNNLLSLIRQTDTTVINGKTFTKVYEAETKEETTTTPQSRSLVRTFDSKGKVIQEQLGTNLEPTSYTYDSNGRPSTITLGTTSPRVYTFTYSPENGLLESVTDPLSQTTSFTYDAAGRLDSETSPNGKTILYTYDLNGNLTSITPPGKPAHDFVSNNLDLVSSYVAPDIGLTSQMTSYAYNKDNALSLITRPDGKTVSFAYDAAERLNSINADGDIFELNYDLTTGKLTSISDPFGGEVGFTYDGDLLLSSTLSGEVSGEVNFIYNNDFLITSESINEESPIYFSYDNDGLLTQAGSITLTRSADHGLITATALSALSSTVMYTEIGELEAENCFYSGSAIFSTGYTRDDLGRITEKQVISSGATIPYSYTYDGMGRLNTATSSSSVSTYTYDDNGNRLSKTKDGVVTNATYDNQDRLLTYGENTYTNTDNGELLTKTNSGGTTNYNYDVLGNLRSATLPDGTNIQYVIDGQNRRVGKKVNGSLIQGFIYKDQLKPIAELDGSNNIVSTFIYASKSNIPDYMVKEGITYRIISDHLGSPQLVINVSDGSIAQEITYDEFGNILSDSNPGFQPFGFAGGIYDADTKLTRFGARDYDAETGRWTAKDPIGFNGGDSNLYGYAINDPINLVDSNGLNPIVIGGGIVIGGTGIIIVGLLVLAGIIIIGAIWENYGDDICVMQSRGKGERGRTAKESGTDNPFKKLRPHPTDPNKVIKKDPDTGRDIVKPKPDGFDDYWNGR